MYLSIHHQVKRGEWVDRRQEDELQEDDLKCLIRGCKD
jgi:hypothetical protein